MTYYGRVSNDGSTRFTTGYMDKALFDLEAVIRQARKDLRDINFDTIVGTGFSGGVVIPTLARSLKVKFALLRKETDDSHHGSGRLLGEIGRRWIFVDDFCSSGNTRRRVLEKVAAGLILNDGTSTYCGDYYYSNFDPTQRWQPEVPDEFVAEAPAVDPIPCPNPTGITVGDICVGKISMSPVLGADWKDVGYTTQEGGL